MIGGAPAYMVRGDHLHDRRPSLPSSAASAQNIAVDQSGGLPVPLSQPPCAGVVCAG